MTSLNQLNVVITGAASGIGKELARELFVKEGCHLTLIDIDERGLEALKNELKPDDDASPALGIGLITCVPTDLGQTQSVENSIEKIKGQKVDLLIHCAGLTYAGLFKNMRFSDFQHILNVNFMGLVQLTLGLLTALEKSQAPAIINMSSLAGIVGAPGMAAYSASKFAVVGFSEALRGEVGDRIHVCTVCPSLVKTGIAKNSLGPMVNDKDVERVAEMERYMRFGTSPKRVARIIISQGIKKRKAKLVINPDAKALYILKRLFPKTSERVAYLLFKHFRKSGVLGL
ncbi:MAG: SDR family NAD(P)-dependent oxidoreductase [Oligoflexia bacterium]|nr:SDR family NAD(P)-dependent oxidoreductase [Oligoflexia bacterium]